MSAWARKKIQDEEDAKKKQEKEAANNVSSNVVGKDVFESGASYSYTSPFKPNSAFHIRNRLLSKMGTTVSLHRCLQRTLQLGIAVNPCTFKLAILYVLN